MGPDHLPARLLRRMPRFRMAAPIFVEYLVLDRDLRAEGYANSNLNAIVPPRDDRPWRRGVRWVNMGGADRRASVKQKGANKVWSVEILIGEGSEETEAEAVVHLGERRFAGWGRARRNPVDPQVPRVGEELASARALADLAHKLFEAAVEEIDSFERS